MPKRVTLVLCRRDGEILGELEPIEVGMPWWQEVSDIVEAVAARDGVVITVLRLLESRLPRPTSPEAWSDVTYLAELHGDAVPAGCRSTRRISAPHPARNEYAKPGGPGLILEWARAELDRAGVPIAGPPVQVRTWNLSAIWRIPTRDGPTWLKAVPPFFAHEPALIAHLSPGPVPGRIASMPGRSLLRHIPGPCAIDGGHDARLGLIDVVSGLHRDHAGQVDDLLALGLFDWRPEALIASARRVMRFAESQSGAEGAPEIDRASLEELVTSLPRRLEALATCGFPESLVHGDASLLNAFFDEDHRLVLLDWGDAGVGHPLYDLEALERSCTTEETAAVHDRLVACWSALVPEREVRRAIQLVRPIGALRTAIVYAGFLDNIEPDEHVYHRDDVPRMLAWAARLGMSE